MKRRDTTERDILLTVLACAALIAFYRYVAWPMHVWYVATSVEAGKDGR